MIFSFYYIFIILLILFSVITYFSFTSGYGVIYHVYYHYIISIIFIVVWGILNSYERSSINRLLSLVSIGVIVLSMIIFLYVPNSFLELN